MVIFYCFSLLSISCAYFNQHFKFNYFQTVRHKKRSKKESESEDTEDSESAESEGEVWLEKKSMPFICSSFISFNHPFYLFIYSPSKLTILKNFGINSHQHQKDSLHIWHHLRKDIVSSCNLRCQLILCS